ncbi:MAG: NifU family protein [Chlamydiia bacterium]|nr:NifU family protein [Chlamydiia bacterium]
MDWATLNKKIRGKLENLRFVGFFTAKEAEEKGMRLVTGREGSIGLQGMVCLYWLVDEADGVIADAKFQVFGSPALIAAAEIASELALRKNYDQASRISAELLDKQARDRKEIPAFPETQASCLNQILSAIDKAVHQCIDIPFAASDYEITPIEWDAGVLPGGIPSWNELSESQKIQIIEEVIDKEVRPYVELDAGGVKVIGLEANGEVQIAYEGACTTCHSSTGSTLSAIQQILKARVHPSLSVIPHVIQESR